MKKGIYLSIVILVFGHFGCGPQPGLPTGIATQKSTAEHQKQPRSRLVILHDISLAQSFRDLAKSFEKTHPSIEVQLEGAAGLLVARKVSDMGRRADIVAVTDYRTIQRVLLSKLCEWYVCFALDEMVIAYTQQSNRRDKIRQSNWFRVVTEKDVTMGLAEPATDPCGYRTKMVFQLASSFYHSRVRGRKIVEILNNPPRKAIVRPTALELLPLLQTGTIDYMFTYRSLAEQHNLMYVRIKDLLNLSAPHMVRFYRKAKVKIPSTKAGEESTELAGEPIVYAFTMMKDCKNTKEARLFADYLIGPEGARVLAQSHQRVIAGGRMGFTTTGQPLLGE